MIIEKRVLEALNRQINREFYSSYLYLSMSFYCTGEGLPGFAKWLLVQHDEERQHAGMLTRHILQRGERVALDAVEIPPNRWENIIDLFESALEHERSITASICNLTVLATEQRDFPVQSLMKWFIDEQMEEEASVEEILNQLRFVKENTSAIFIIDRELAHRTQSA
ncbi:MAG: ferritin [Planctomycetia bacterium]|nr:ferritin [Planctomycetia bacterium]